MERLPIEFQVVPRQLEARTLPRAEEIADGPCRQRRKRQSQWARQWIIAGITGNLPWSLVLRLPQSAPIQTIGAEANVQAGEGQGARCLADCCAPGAIIEGIHYQRAVFEQSSGVG